MVARVVAAFQLEDDGKLFFFFFCDEVSVSISDSKQMYIIFFTHAHDYYHMCLLFLIPARCDHFLQIEGGLAALVFIFKSCLDVVSRIFC